MPDHVIPGDFIEKYLDMKKLVPIIAGYSKFPPGNQSFLHREIKVKTFWGFFLKNDL